MKLLRNIIVLFVISASVQAEDGKPAIQADELSTAYQREILFLSTYKKELAKKLESVHGKLGTKLRDGQKELDSLEKQWLSLQTSNELLLQKLNDVERDYEGRKENEDLLQTTLKQAGNPEGVEESTDSKEEKPMLAQMEGIFSGALKELNASGQISSQEGHFYQMNGEQDKGTLYQMGDIARFVEKNGKIAVLYPSGNGNFKVWKWLGSEAKSIQNNQIPKNLQAFVYESAEKEFVPEKEKTLEEVIEAGGLVGYIIIALGFFALAITFIRLYLLRRADSRNDKLLEEVIQKINNNEVEEAQHLLLQESNAVSRILSKTLSFLKAEPQKVEDAILEAILKESQMIDRFGVVILVIASVAPLLGLLGTVTGMIATFDVITLYGTANPKLLSGGISEALVTTMLGLIVAIPGLLIGSFLNTKTDKIKIDMEKWALATCNAFKNRGTV